MDIELEVRLAALVQRVTNLERRLSDLEYPHPRHVNYLSPGHRIAMPGVAIDDVLSIPNEDGQPFQPGTGDCMDSPPVQNESHPDGPLHPVFRDDDDKEKK